LDIGEIVPKPQSSCGNDGLCDLDYALATIIGDLLLDFDEAILI
jgi:hypothetical protein